MKQDYATLPQFQRWAAREMLRDPDFIISPNGTDVYLRRWWIVPRNEYTNVYLHEILRSDDDRAPHDHPWANRTLVIDGEMIEHEYYKSHWIRSRTLTPGMTAARFAVDSHRLEIPAGGRCITLFTTGPKIRDWGFWCWDNRFVPWQEFTGGESGERIGRGCE